MQVISYSTAYHDGAQKKFKILVTITLIAVLFVPLFFINYGKGTKEKASEPVPAELSLALERVQRGIGTIHEQRDDLDKISTALDAKVVTTSSLNQNGEYWVYDLKHRVNIREAILAWCEVKEMASRASELAVWEVEKAEKLNKLIGRQIGTPSTDSEGLVITHVNLWQMMYRIRHRGKNPP